MAEWIQRLGDYSPFSGARKPANLSSWGLSNNALAQLANTTQTIAQTTAPQPPVTQTTAPSMLSYVPQGDGTEVGQHESLAHPDPTVMGAIGSIGGTVLGGLAGPMGALSALGGRVMGAVYDGVTGNPLGTTTGLASMASHAFGDKPDSLSNRLDGALGTGVGGPSPNQDKADAGMHYGGDKDTGFAGHSNMNDGAPSGATEGGSKGPAGEPGESSVGLASTGAFIDEDGLKQIPSGRFFKGPTPGMADTVEAEMPSGKARLSHGEFVLPADFVSMLGDGNSEAGASKLEAAVAKLRKLKTGRTKQARPFEGTLMDLL